MMDGELPVFMKRLAAHHPNPFNRKKNNNQNFDTHYA